MSTKRYLFTRKGFDAFQKKTADLEKRLRNLQLKSAEIAEVGGNQYHDNASYEMLVIDLRGLDFQLKQSHAILNNAVIVNLNEMNEAKVTIGKKVLVNKNGVEKVWHIVGYGESDPSIGLITYNAPLAQLILNKTTGDIVDGVIAGNKVQIEILDVTKSEVMS